MSKQSQESDRKSAAGAKTGPIASTDAGSACDRPEGATMSGTVSGVYSVSKEAKLGGLEILQTRHPIAVPEGWSIEKDIKHFSTFWWWEEGTVDYAALMYKSMLFS